MKVKKYGTSYAVLASETRVEVEARIVDLRSGELLWQGRACGPVAGDRDDWLSARAGNKATGRIVYLVQTPCLVTKGHP